MHHGNGIVAVLILVVVVAFIASAIRPRGN